LRWGAAILLLGIAEQWLPGGSGHIWLWSLGAWLFCLAAEGALARSARLQVDWQIPQPLRLGRRAEIAVRITRRGYSGAAATAYLPPPAGIDGSPQPHRFELGTAGNTGAPALVEQWLPLQLGAVPAPALQLRLLGVLGLAWWSRRCTGPALRPVAPDLYAADARAGGGRPGSGTAAARPGSGQELLGLRDYRSGDPLRMVAWKASARGQRMLVRELAAEQQLDIVLILDAGRAGRQQIGGLTRLHHAVNAAARLAQRATALGDHVGLIVYDGSGIRTALAPAAGVAALRRLRERLATAAAQPDDADPVPAAMALRRLCRRRTLALWFTDVDSGAGIEPLRECTRLLVPLHLPLFAGIVDADVEALVERPPRSFTDAYVTLAAVQALQAGELQALTLRQRGSKVVRAAPAVLDRRLLATYESLRLRRAV
jgi:uncharacterized protein (DUF58 family)